MKDQYKNIIQKLEKSKGWMTSGELASLMGVSVRSVKNYISEINFLYKNCIDSSHKGYRLKSREVFDEVKKEDEIPVENDERTLYLVKRLLQVEEEKQISTDDLAEEMYISNGVLFKVLKSAKILCEQFHVEMTLSNTLLSINGEEEDKRKLLKHIYLVSSGSNKLSIDDLQKQFHDFDIQVIKSILHETCKKHKYYINGYSFDYLILDTLVTLHRIVHHHSGTSQFKEIIRHDTEEFAVAKEIIGKFENIFCIRFNAYEVDAYTSILVSYLMKLNYKTITKQDLILLTGEDCIRLVDKILSVVEDYYFIHIENYDFYVKFVIHIYNLIYRAQNDMAIKNPITKTIKRNNPLLFDCGVKIADIIQSEMDCPVSEDEIAYIAIHIGAALRPNDQLHNKLQAVLVFPQYYNFHLMLEERISHDFENDVEIVDVVTSIAELKCKQIPYQFVISVIPLDLGEQTCTVEINSFYTPKDYQKIYDTIQRIRKDQQKNLLLEQLVSISLPDLFEKNGNFHTKDEVLRHIHQIMVAHGYCDENYLEEVYKREEASSTNFGNIAVPHGLSLNCHKTGIFIFLSERGIKWGEGIVNIVIFLSINKNDADIFRNVYDNLIVLLLDNKVVTEVLKSKDYYNFIEIIMDSF